MPVTMGWPTTSTPGCAGSSSRRSTPGSSRARGYRSLAARRSSSSEYRLAAEEKAKLLETQASKLFEDGNEANQVSDDFVLAAVLFASVLFFSGLAGTFDSLRAQTILLVLGGLMLVVGTIIVLTLPQDVGF